MTVLNDRTRLTDLVRLYEKTKPKAWFFLLFSRRVLFHVAMFKDDNEEAFIKLTSLHNKHPPSNGGCLLLLS